MSEKWVAARVVEAAACSTIVRGSIEPESPW
jgi:hypothetical protein